MATCLKIEFIAMPRANHVPVPAEPHPAARLVGHDDLLDLVEQPALTYRAAMVRTAVLIGNKPFAQAKHADLQLADGKDAVIALGYVACAAHHNLSHCQLSLKLGSPDGRTTWRCRTD